MNKFRILFTAALFAFLLSAYPAPLQAQNTVKIISGNGQLICALCLSTFPMTVQVTNNGVPQAGISVNWTISSGGFGGYLASGASTSTDGNGMVSNIFAFTSQSFTGSPFNQFEQSLITASTGDASATFTETRELFDPVRPGNSPVTATPLQFLQELFAGTPFGGQAGTSGTRPLQIRIGGSTGTPIPNVSIQLVNFSDPSTGPVVVCKENDGGINMALSDANGIATCTPQFGGVPGTGRFFVLVGGGGTPVADPASPSSNLRYTNAINFTVTAATPGSIKILSGNNQSANPSQTLPTAFQVEVDSFTGSPLSGQTVRWTVNPSNGISLSTFETITDVSGRTSVLGTLTGVANGSIQVTATVLANTSLSSTFTVTAIPRITVTGFTIFSGNNQSAPVSTAFAQPLVVQVTTSAGSAAGVAVQFQTSSSLVLSSTSATTDTAGRAQINVTAGTVTGPASVVATVVSSTGIGSQTFGLTVLPPAPTITAANFVNGADQQANSLSPCSLGAIVAPAGTLGIANSSPTFPGQPLPPSGARLTVNDTGAPILGISTLPNGQQQAIQFQVPCETNPGSSVPFALSLGGGTTNVNLNVQAASPGIYQTAQSDGVLRAVIIRPDGSFATVSNPTRRGEPVSVMVTGLGRTSPAVGTGAVPPPGTAANVQGTVIVGVGCCGAPVVSSKLTEDLPGVYIVTFTVPGDAQTGSNVTMSVAVIPPGSNSPVYSAGAKIPVL